MAAFEQVSNRKVNHVFQGRRGEDVASCYAKAEKAKRELDWYATLDIDAMMQDAGNPTTQMV